MRTILFPLLLVSLFILERAQAQNKSVSIGTLTPDNSAVLDLESTTQGFLMTRLDSSHTTAIVTPAHGLIVFNTQDECYWYKKTNHWVRLCSTDSLVNLFINTKYLKADTIITNYIKGQAANFDTIISKYIRTNIIYGDTAIFNILNAHFSKLDTIFNTYLVSQHIKADTIINQYFSGNVIKGDTIISKYYSGTSANFDTIINKYLTSKLILADSLYVGGQTIQSVITSAIDTSAWLLRGNSGTSPTSNFLGSIDNQDLVLRTNNVERLRILKSGEAGFGTSAPITAVDVQGQITLRTGAAVGAVLQSDINGTGSWQSVSNIVNNTYLNGLSWELLGNKGTTPSVNFLGTIDNQDLVIRTDSIERLRVLNSGQVGVGVTVPITAVDVQGQITLRSGATAGAVLQSDVNGTGTWQNVSNIINNTFLNNLSWGLLGNTGTNPAINFVGTSDNQDVVLRTNNTERVRVLKTGQVGFGIAAPITAVDVQGQITLRTGAAAGAVLQSDVNGTGTWQNVSSIINNTYLNNLSWGLLGNTGTNPAINFVGTTDSKDLAFRSNSIEGMRLQVGGNVGIGTNNPTANLHLYSSTSIFTRFLIESATGYPMQTMIVDGAGLNNKNFITYADLTGDLFFTVGNDAQTAATNWLQMNRNGITINKVLFPHGNIGIATPTPLNLLDVNGAMAIGTYAGTNAAPAGTSLIVSGNVGIGTATPGTSLDVRSGVSSDNMRIGDNSSSTSYFKIGRNTATNNLDFTSVQGASAGFTFMSGKVGIGTTTPTELLSVCAGSLVTVNTTGNMNVIAGTAANPAIGFNNNATGFYSSGQNIMSTVTNGTTCFTIDDGAYNISLLTPVGAVTPITSGTGNLLFGNATIAGSDNVVLVTDPSNVSAISGIDNFVLGSHISVTTSGNLIAGMTNIISSPNSIVLGTGNTLTGGAGNNCLMGNGNTLTGATTGNNVILGGGCAVNSVFGSAVLNPNNVSFTVPANLTFYGIFPLGYRFFSNNTFTAGVEVAPGGGSWTSISDRNMKENIIELNYQDILTKFCSLPVAQWSYIAQRPDAEGKYNHYKEQPKHIGVMAQDFNASFGFGEFDNRITDSDLMGVLSACVLAINEKTKKIDDLEKQVTALTGLVNKLLDQKEK